MTNRATLTESLFEFIDTLAHAGTPRCRECNRLLHLTVEVECGMCDNCCHTLTTASNATNK